MYLAYYFQKMPPLFNVLDPQPYIQVRVIRSKKPYYFRLFSPIYIKTDRNCSSSDLQANHDEYMMAILPSSFHSHTRS